MSEFNPIIYRIQQNQQDMISNNMSTITTDINDFKEIDSVYLYILSPKKNQINIHI